ncbi:MAG TPA: DUF1501 domain-containing protein [Thermoleophilaceae bacterium]|nr:DUF1501 domain-containing protein [Thermoleophilaceae bacterium]
MDAHRCTSCAEFSRANLLRTGIARAGSGLPAIEPGMPAPAGSGLSRRSFLMRGAGLGLTVYGASTLLPQAFEEGIAAAAAAAPDAPVLVSIYFPGGIDGLSVLAPVDDANYRRLRPNLAIAPTGVPADRFAEDTRLQWHPSARPLRTLHSEGKVNVMPAIGYAGPEQSHFTSRHFWEVGEIDPRARLGWIGRYLDLYGAPDNPLQGLGLSDWLMPALAGASAPISTLRDPTNYSLHVAETGEPVTSQTFEAYRATTVSSPDDDAELATARRATRHVMDLRDELNPLRGVTPQPTVTYPKNEFSRRLSLLAEMLQRGLPLRCVSIQSAAGYDTHEGQKGVLDQRLALDISSVYTFQRDIEARGLADRVLIHVWTEFGRRPYENGPDGTDHGSGGISFLIGNQVTGQMIGEYPGLASFDATGNMLSNVDFRSVYCSMLEQWLGVDAEPVIPGAAGLARPQLIAA